MRSRLLIKLILVSCFIQLATLSFGQRDTIEYIRSPYRTESTPYFKLNSFKRGFSTDSLRLSLDSLEAKRRIQWSRKDSLSFAQISLGTGNTSLSDYYFDHLNVKLKSEENFWYDHLMIYYLKNEFDTGIDLIKKDSPMILGLSKMYFFERIFEAKLKQQKDEKWYKTNSVFNWEIDSSLNTLNKKDPTFVEAVIIPLRNLEFVLNRIILFVHEDDPIIASAAREMGHIIEGHLNLTQAYIAYSLGRHYNKRDKALLEDLKEVKAKMTEKNFKIPNFRKYFPRIEEWRFEYKVLKEKVIFAQNDTIVYVKPETMAPKEEPLLKFPHQYIVLGGLLLMMIILAIILKTRKR